MDEKNDRGKFKCFIGGTVGVIAVAGLTYFGMQCGKIRGEKIISLAEINGTTVKVIQQDRKWDNDLYRVELLDRKGNIRAEFPASSQRPNIVFYDFYEPQTPKQDLENSLDGNDL